MFLNGLIDYLVFFSNAFHYVKSVHIRSFSSPFFHAFGLNTERYRVPLRIQFKCGKIQARKTPNTDIFHVVFSSCHILVLLIALRCIQNPFRRLEFVLFPKVVNCLCQFIIFVNGPI